MGIKSLKILSISLIGCCSSFCISQTLHPAPDYSLLKNYKIIVLGEKHGDPEVTKIEAEIVQQFSSQRPRLLLEGPFELNFRLNKFLYTDTVSSFSNLNPHKTVLFELAREHRYPLRLIDIPRYHSLQNDETYALMSGCYNTNKQLLSAETFLAMRYF